MRIKKQKIGISEGMIVVIMVAAALVIVSLYYVNAGKATNVGKETKKYLESEYDKATAED